MAASNLFYIKVLGIQPDFTIDDIVAYFQTARCGSGIVDKVIYLDAKKSAVLIGIEGLTDRASDKLFKGSHKLKGKNVSVRNAKPPTEKQRAQAVFTTGKQSVSSTLTSTQHTPPKKVPSQQEPLMPALKPNHSITMTSSEQLPIQSNLTGTTVQSQSEPWQTTNQVQPVLMSPQVGNTQAPSMDLGSTTRPVELSQFQNMNIFEAAQLPPAQFPIARPDSEPAQSSSPLTTSEPSLLDASPHATNASQSHMQANVFQVAPTLPLSSPLVDPSQLGNQGNGNTRMTISQEPLTQSVLEEWRTLQNVGHPSQDGMQQHAQGNTVQQQAFQAVQQQGVSLHLGYPGLQYQSLNVHQHGDFAGLQHSTHAGPQQGKTVTLQRGVHTSLQHGTHTGLQHNLYASPQQGAHTGPQQGAHTAPQQGAHTAPQQGAHTGPQQGAHTGPQQGAHTGPQQGAHTGPQQGAHTGPQQGAHTGPQQGAHTGPQQGAYTAPQQGAHTGPQQGAHTGPQQGAHTGPQQGAYTAPQQAAHTGPQQGAHTGPQQGAHTGPQQGAHTGPQQGAHTGPQQGAHTGPQQGAHTGPQQGAHTGPQQGAYTAPQQGAHTGPQQDAHTGPQQDAHTGPQQGAHTGPQQGAHTGPQQGAYTAPQQGAHTGPQQDAHTGPQQDAHTGPQQGAHTGPQQGAHTGLQHEYNPGLLYSAPFGLQPDTHTAHEPLQGVSAAHLNMGVLQSGSQGELGKSSSAPMGFSPSSTGNQRELSLPIEESVKLNAPHEWPSFSTESEDTVPAAAQAQLSGQHSLPSNEGGVVVQVEGVTGLTSDSLDLAFDDEDKGGGEIDDIQWKGDIALISFKEKRIAAQVASKDIWRVMGRTVKVSLYQPKPDPLHEILAQYTRENTLVLRDLPASVTDEHLFTHLELVAGMTEDEDFKFDRREDSALLKLNRNMAQDVWQKLSSSSRPLVKKAKTMLKVEILPPANAVKLEGFKDDCCSEEFLEMYFKNKKKSGAGGNVSVVVTGRQQAAITFEDIHVIPSVLSHNHSKVLGQRVSVKLYHPILSDWFKADGSSAGQPKRAKSMQHKFFTVPVSAAIHHHFKRTDFMSPLNEKLMGLCGKATLTEKGILVEPTTGSEWNEQWVTQCKEAAEKFKSSISELFLDVPPGVMDKVYRVIAAQVHNPNVTISPTETGDQVYLVGSTFDVEELEAKIKKIVYEHLDTNKDENLPVPVLVLIDQCVGQQLKKAHTNVLFETFLQKDKLQVSGKDASCDKFLEDVQKLHPEVIDVRLGKEAVCLLASASGKALLLSKIGEQPVGYYFTDVDGKLPTSDLAIVTGLHLVSENREVAIKVAKDLQSTLAIHSVDVPEEFKHTVRSQAWCATRRRIENNFIAQLFPQPETRKVVVACDSMHAVQIKADLEQFVRDVCYSNSTIKMERLQWEYMDKYDKDWKDFLDDIKGSGLKYSLPGATGSAVIKIGGEATPLAKFARRVHEICDNVKVGKKEVSKPGAVKHFQSTTGKKTLKGIAAEQKAVVEVYTVEEEAEEANRATASLHRKICHGTTDDGRILNIMQGDLTEFSADVMVNAANEQLNHVGGIAGIISGKGGPIVQEESTKYVERAGQLNVGDAVLLKAVGNLPCKAIVHAVGPRWNGGHAHEEAYLAKAVRNSLVEASKHNYTSIAFPAISSGIFGVPVDICARAMMQGIKEFSALGKPPQLSSITIMLFQGEHINTFTQAANGVLKEFSEQPGGCSASAPHSSVQKKASSTGPRRPSGVPAVQGLELKKGSLTSYQADVYVNTAHNQLNLNHGAVAQSLLKAGGSTIQDECNRVVASRGTIAYWDIATTTGGYLQCQHIIHTVGANYQGRGCEQNMESMITKVMQECDRLKATSVAFPALGSGNLGFPEKVVAEVMVRTISSYLSKNPRTTVKKVLLVIFMDSTHRAFQQAIAGTPSVPSAVHHVESNFEVVGEVVDAPSTTEVYAGPSEVLYSFSCNRVNVDIVNGDISADDSEGIINTASESLQLHNFGVMGALRRKGGQELQDECNVAVAKYGHLEQHKVIVTGVGRRTRDGLKCLKILHVLAPQYSGGLARTVLEALKRADQEGLRSVALPAIGTGEHGFSSAQAAEGIADGILQFSKSVHNNVASIKVILFQRDQFGSFAWAFEEAGKKKGFLKRAFDRMTKGAKWAVESFLGVPPTPHYSGSSQQSASVRYSETTVLCIKVYAGDTSAIDNVFKEVDMVIAEMIKEDYVKDDKVNKLSAKAEADLTRQAEIHHVRMSIDRAPLNQVRFNGERADVLLMKSAVQEELRQIESEENRLKEADLLTSKFQWQWKDVSGNFQNYEAMSNFEIEEAYGKHKKSVVVKTEAGPRSIDFDQMYEMDVRPPYGFTTVRRRDFEQERKEGEHPSSWVPMPVDPGTGREVECHVVQLSPTSKEYSDVATQFNLTMGGGGLSTRVAFMQGLGQANQGRIQKIERIQNSKLYAQYIARKKAMDRANPGHQNERQLFHGCSLAAVDPINQGGFNRSYAGQHGTAYGKGVYFARNASYSSSARYAAPDHNGHQHMYLARVLTGEYTTGQSGYLVPPAKDRNNPAVLYDSVADNVQNPTMFVIFYDPQAYPEYHIEFC